MSAKLFFLVCFFFLLLFQESARAQNTIALRGSITDSETGLPVVNANVVLPGLSIGTISDENGKFYLHHLPAGSTRLQVRYIGYRDFSIDLDLKKDTLLQINLKSESLGLEEVTVSAENSREVATSSEIGAEAIEHVQASSLKEVLQLLPGNLAENPRLDQPARISLRETDDDINSALGTAIIIDGIPFSNDANLQKSMQSGFASVAGTGVDLRQIPVDNIEAILVDVGIPSAEYGNLTSGAVRIKTKSGASPIFGKLQANPHTKQAVLGKGSLLGKNAGVINIDAGYTDSYRDLNRQTDRFQRLGLTGKYNITFFRNDRPLKLETKLSYLGTIDGRKWDPDMKAEEEHRAKDRRTEGKISANWSLNGAFLKSLDLDVAYSQTRQDAFEKMLESSSSGPNFFVTSKLDGEYEISFGPPTYYSEVKYNSRPFDFYSQLKARFFHHAGETSHRVLAGADWRTSGNSGKGRIFDPERPPAGLSTRQRPFSDVPSLQQFSLFLQDEITLKLAGKNLLVMAGLRMDNISTRNFGLGNGMTSFDPRINLRYNIIDRPRNTSMNKLSLRAGFGQTTKTPTLLHLYPEPVYADVVNLNNHPYLVVATTQVINETANPALETSKGKKFEAGIDFQINRAKSRITAFYEKYEGGFVSDRNFFLMQYRRYEQPAQDLQLYYRAGEGVFYNDPQSGIPTAVPFEIKQKFNEFSVFRNAGTRIKRGLEYSLDFGKLDALKTSFLLTGAWLQTESYTADAPYWREIPYTIYENNVSRQASFTVKYANRSGYGIVRERVNTNLNIITHIPELKMLVTLTTQAVWMEKDRRKLYAGFPLYTLTELRNYLQQPGLFQSDAENDFYYFLPESYRDYSNVERQYTIADFGEQLAQMAIDKLPRYRFAARSLPPLFLCNIKISKDLGRRLKLSFYANNFLNIRPWVLDKRENIYLRRNQEPYFGAELRFKL